MLKEVTPEERLSEIHTHKLRLEPFVSFGACACLLLMFLLMRDDVPTGWTFIAFLLFWIASVVLSGLLAMLIWLPLTMWLGQMSLKEAIDPISNPNLHPRVVERYLEVWWKNEFALDVFVVVFRVAICVGLFRLFAPLFGIV